MGGKPSDEEELLQSSGAENSVSGVKLSNRVVSFEDDACIVDEDVKMVRERRNKMDCLPNCFPDRRRRAK